MATPLPSTPVNQSAAEQIADLMDQVRTKDTLVLQLTERLEQAAEQLDRLHRLGADKRHGSAGGGSASGIIEPLTTKIDEAIDAWAQTGPQFDYIVQRLDEIAGAIQSGHFSPAPDPKSSSKSAPASGGTAPAPSGGGTAGGSFWEKMKSNMMDGAPAPVAAVSAPAPQPNSTPSDQGATDTALNDPVQRISAPTPGAIDVEAAPVEELREAVISRENYITALISELRTAEPMPDLPGDLQSSGLAPDDLVARLLELESRLKTKMLREELDLSLERARIARERVKLDQVKSQLESQIKRLSGATSDSPSSTAGSGAPPADDPATGKLSWLKRLKGAK